MDKYETIEDLAKQPLTDVILDAWVGALRSGEYTQSTGSLCTIRTDGSIGNCCLGVLGRVMGLSVEHISQGGYLWTGFSRDVLDSLGDPANPYALMSFDQQAEFVSLNDEQGKSFSDIAAHIDANRAEILAKATAWFRAGKHDNEQHPTAVSPAEIEALSQPDSSL